jgi:hypothetical protein
MDEILAFEAHPETCECGCPTTDHDDLCDGTAECANCMVLCAVEIL